jgi:hypothetical protein
VLDLLGVVATGAGQPCAVAPAEPAHEPLKRRLLQRPTSGAAGAA